ncbi:phosphatase PAP2 family protein [Neomoorella mulderi]|uniref:Undecaprenyl-diphosphatase BcrC n=1 Tax=Moorella mulderi DSM 14980 TaxID=1122241 RepID=A0A151B1X5_9FIRM|nr:phosphatase PAP2 family protein [Moorella mulderi]KYH33876.1 undecaprenyl-diphosphatase BcrC [Moorella mulderi DSM 14980]
MTLRRWLNAGDCYLFYYVNQRLQCPLLDRTMPWFTLLGSATFGLALSLATALLGREQTRLAGWQAMLALVGSHLVVRFCKGLVGRCRPYLVLSGARYLARPWQDFSFPSGHTAASFSLAVVFALNFPVLTWPLVTAAGLTGLSRMYVGMHYPSDVLGGATVGALFAYAVHSWPWY